MTKTLIVAAGLAVASSASADLTSGPRTNLLSPEFITISAQEIGTPDLGSVIATHYSNIAGNPGYSSFPAATGNQGFDDYVSTASAPIDLSSFRFVGGVQQVGGTMFFDFFDASSNFVDSFGVALSQAGNFIWTITINTFPGGVVVPEAGFVQATVGAGFTGQWFLSTAAPTVGTENPLVGGAAGGFSHKFEINGEVVPAPATAALMGLGGLVAVRRRR